MTASSSWFRRVGRSVRVCLVSLGLALVWILPVAAATVVPPLLAGPLLAMVTAAFIFWASVLLHAVHNLQSGILLMADLDFRSEIALAQETPVVITSAIVLLVSGSLLIGVARRVHATARPRLAPMTFDV